MLYQKEIIFVLEGVVVSNEPGYYKRVNLNKN